MILRGMLLLARGRADGIKEFPNTKDAFYASLAPLIAFPLVGAGITAANGDVKLAAVAFLARLCAVLALPLITFEFARLTGHGANWLRTVAALNWSFWLMVPLLMVAALFGALLVSAGLEMTHAESGALALMAVYMFWLNWFTLRKGLQMGGAAAALLVVLNFAAIGLCAAGPLLLGQFDPSSFQ
jgi:hypothetical protein